MRIYRKIIYWRRFNIEQQKKENLDVLLLLHNFEGIAKSHHECLLKIYKNVEELAYAVKNEQPELYTYVKAEFKAIAKLRLCQSELERLKEQMQLKGVSYIPHGEGLLYVHGEKALLDEKGVCVIGSRDCSSAGVTACEEVCHALDSCGVAIVSTKGYGINEVALKKRKKSIAVVCGGLQNERLVSALSISTFPLTMPPLKHMYAECNSLMIEYSCAVVIAEATEKSNCLSVADIAKVKNIPIYALPGSIINARCQGSNLYIKENPSSMLLSVNDLILSLGIKARKKEKAAVQVALTEEQERILACILRGENTFEEILQEFDCSVDDLSGILTVMEISGMIEKSAGNKYIVM